jgi:hypothetical protein
MIARRSRRSGRTLWEAIIRDKDAEPDFTAVIKPIEKAAGVVVGGGKGDPGGEIALTVGS